MFGGIAPPLNASVRRLVDREFTKPFRFLVDNHGFGYESTVDACAFRSAALIVELSFNDRDGFDTHLLFPARGTDRVAVGTILGSLRVSKPFDVAVQAAFIKSQLSKLAAIPVEVYGDLVALRFWHAEPWPERWGTAILLTSTSASIETARLRRIQEFFAIASEQVA